MTKTRTLEEMIEIMISTYKEELKHNIRGQSAKHYFGWLSGVEYAFDHIGVDKDQLAKIQEEVFTELIEQGYGENVNNFKNGNPEKNWKE